MNDNTAQSEAQSPDCTGSTAAPCSLFKSQERMWLLVAPNGDTWEGDSPLRCIRKEKDERIPAHVQLERLAAFMADDDWTSVDDDQPCDELLDQGDQGAFWCFFAGEKGVNQQGVRIFTKGSGWNDGDVTHWMPLPDEPK